MSWYGLSFHLQSDHGKDSEFLWTARNTLQTRYTFQVYSFSSLPSYLYYCNLTMLHKINYFYKLLWKVSIINKSLKIFLSGAREMVQQIRALAAVCRGLRFHS